MLKRPGHLIIKQHQPTRTVLMGAVYALLIAVGGWSLFMLGQRTAGFRIVELADAVEQAKEYSHGIEGENAKLREQLALLEQNRQIEQQAVTNVDSSLKELQQEILELKEEVAFYRGIVSPREAGAGLTIQNFKLEKTSDERVFRFKLVLTQVVKNDGVVKGQIKMHVSGTKDGKPVNLSLADISNGAVPNLDMRFKYFQTVEGAMTLPSGFTPANVQVEIVPLSGKTSGVTKSYDWAALAG